LLPPLDPGDSAIEAIVRIGDRLSAMYGRRVPLFYGSDDYLKLIYAHRYRLERYFLLLLNDAEVADALISKDRFQELAESRGLPIPRSLSWEGTGAGTVAGTPGPVLAKPSNKVDWSESALKKRVFHAAKALVFPSGEALAAEPTVKLFREQLTVQEYVPGDDGCNWSFHGVADANGAVLDSFVGRKIRTFPPGSGESAFIELDDDAELSALGARIAAILPLKGVFKMDFKKDARTGEWYLLEINARFNLWHYLGARNGLNLLRVVYDHLLEGARPLNPHVYATEFRWLSFELDLRAFRQMRARGELGLFSWLASIVASRNIYNVFAWRDPGPWLVFWGHRLSRRWERGPSRLFSMVRQWLFTAS
jgi:predicted ATP-grasp superfamily ATP-dependent carboligase